MELLDKGKHCEEEFCHQLDFLPMKCKACSKSFCREHIKYDLHDCKESYKFNYKIPTCPTCNQTIEFQRGKDLDICLAEHMQNCDEEMALNNKLNNISLKKKSSNQCCALNCRFKKDIIKFECQRCSKSYCVKHRMQEDHDCSALKTGQQHSSSAGVFKTCGQQHRATTGASNDKNKFTIRNY